MRETGKASSNAKIGSEEDWWNYLNRELNREQKELVTAEAPVIMGLAGPGSGKTRALIYRAAHLIKQGVPPYRILLVTFTNKASEEMKNRLHSILGYYPREMWAGTFHSLGARVLRNYAAKLGRTPDFTIMDEDDRAALWKNLIYKYKETLTEDAINILIKKKMAEKVVSQSYNSRRAVEEIIGDFYPWLEEYTSWIKELRSEYENSKREMNAFDFDDLLVKWLELLEQDPQVREEYQEKFDHVLCDEFQDTNVVQGELVDILLQKSSACVVGDDAQSIYGFRFAELSNMVNFPERHPSCRVIRIEQNFRSHPEIVEIANQIISYNTNQLPKKLYSEKPAGEKPLIAHLEDAREEARYVADKIEEITRIGVPMSEIAVLYRSSYLSSELEFELLRRKKAYRTFGGKKLVHKAHVKDVLAWLKLVYNPRDAVSWRRVISLHKGLGPATAEKVINKLARSSQPLQEVLAGSISPSRGKEGWNTIVETLGVLSQAESINNMVLAILDLGYYNYLQKNYPESWEERYRDLDRLSQYGDRYSDLGSFLEVLSIEEALFWGEEENSASYQDHLVLSTIHSAKGKEWDSVFIIALNEGTFPSRRVEDLEEERRLFYVATTRARRYLFLTSYEIEFRFGKTEVTRPSIFLRELYGG